MGFDERLAMAAQQLLRARAVALDWPDDALEGGIARQPLQPSGFSPLSSSSLCALSLNLRPELLFGIFAARWLCSACPFAISIPSCAAAGDILAARIAQMRMAADEALAAGLGTTAAGSINGSSSVDPSGDGGNSSPADGAARVPGYMTAMLQCAAERRALLDGALRALWGPPAAPR